jgi:ABC-type antimicrobial peptide transport system permease subunit
MTEYIASQISETSFTTALLTTFAVLGALLAIIGVYGVISYLVIQRQRELGVRLALGARRVDVLWLIVRQGIFLSVLGTLVGLIGVLFLSHTIANLLYDVSPLDMFTLTVVTTLLLIVALMASVIPARHVARINPVLALRSE